MNNHYSTSRGPQPALVMANVVPYPRATGVDIFLVAKVRLVEPPRPDLSTGGYFVPVGMMTLPFIPLEDISKLLRQLIFHTSDPETKSAIHAELAALDGRFLHPFTQWQHRNEPWPAQPCPMAMTTLSCAVGISQILRSWGATEEIIDHKDYPNFVRRPRNIKVFCDISETPQLNMCIFAISPPEEGHSKGHGTKNPFANSQLFHEHFPPLSFHEAITALLDPLIWPQESVQAIRHRLREDESYPLSPCRVRQHSPDQFAAATIAVDREFLFETRALFKQFASGGSLSPLGSVNWTMERVQAFIRALQELPSIPDRLLDWLPCLYRPAAGRIWLPGFLDLGPFAVTFSQARKLLHALPETRVLSLSNKDWVNAEVLIALRREFPNVTRLTVMDCPNLTPSDMKKLDQMGALDEFEVVRTTPSLSRSLPYAPIQTASFSLILRGRETIEGRRDESFWRHGISKYNIKPNAILKGLFNYLSAIDPTSLNSIRSACALRASFSQLPVIQESGKHDELVDPNTKSVRGELFAPGRAAPSRPATVQPFTDMCGGYVDGNTRDGWIFILDADILHVPPQNIRSTLRWGLLKIADGRQQQYSLRGFIEDVVFNSDPVKRATYARCLPNKQLVAELNLLLNSFVAIPEPQAESVLASMDETFRLTKSRKSKAQPRR